MKTTLYIVGGTIGGLASLCVLVLLLEWVSELGGNSTREVTSIHRELRDDMYIVPAHTEVQTTIWTGFKPTEVKVPARSHYYENWRLTADNNYVLWVKRVRPTDTTIATGRDYRGQWHIWQK